VGGEGGREGEREREGGRERGRERALLGGNNVQLNPQSGLGTGSTILRIESSLRVLGNSECSKDAGANSKRCWSTLRTLPGRIRETPTRQRTCQAISEQRCRR